VLLCSVMVFSCATKKKKGDVSKFGKFYHNLNSEYNGYFNANELIKESTAILRENNTDNYSNLLDVYDFVAVSDPKMVYGQLDKSIEKVTRVAAIHEVGDWVDDCYVLMGKAQFLKQDYESSVETFEFFQDEFNPTNPFGRNYKKRKVSRTNNKAASKERKKELEAERKAKDDEKKQAQKDLEKKREEAKNTKEQERKDLQKQKEEEQKKRKKEAEDRKKEAEERRKARSQGKRVPKTETPTTPQPTEVKKDPVVKTPVKTTPSKDTVAESKPVVAEETPKEKQKEKADKSAYNEGLLWLAKAYTRTEQYANAEYLLNRIDELTDHKKEVKVGWAPAMADLKIKQKEYNAAVQYLDMAYETADRKEDKARYAFIAGQISGLNGRYAEAGAFFEKAKKKAGKNFKLKFMAQLNQLKNNALDGNNGVRDVEKGLEKMLKEDKNKDYKDQIYFALGEIEFNRNETTKALEYFSQSVQNNGNDPILKAEAYYKIAGMYYGSKKYVEAKAYFDSTAMNMAVKDPRGIAVADMSRKLKDVAESLSTIIKLDSLLAISELDKDALMEIAKQRKMKNESGNGQKLDPATSSPLFTAKRTVSLNSTFFAYNPINLENGKKEFTKIWGEIPLEDNWRRSNKSLASGSNITYTDTPVEEVSAKIDDEEFKKLMADIPFEQTQKIRYNNQISEALYKLGSKLKLDLEDYEESNKYLERLVLKYPNDNKRLDALYLLFTNYSDQNDQVNVTRIRKMILDEYPESNYAKIIKDPSYVNELISESMRVETYYDDTYKMFEARNYKSVIDRAANAGNLFGTDNKFMAKFSLISAMSIGFLEGKDAYIKGLQETIVRYPGTPEETKAKEVMRFLKGDESSFTPVNVQEVDNIFSKEDDSRHYVAVVLFDYSEKALQAAKISILNYNKEFFSLENLQLGEQILSKDEGTQVIMVRSFENMAKARKYYDTVIKDQEKFISSGIAAYELLPITQRNFRKMVAEKTHASYRTFFESNYK